MDKKEFIENEKNPVFYRIGPELLVDFSKPEATVHWTIIKFNKDGSIETASTAHLPYLSREEMVLAEEIEIELLKLFRTNIKARSVLVCRNVINVKKIRV